MDPEIVKDIIIPAAGILIPTGIAVWLARSERKAGEADRIEERLDKGVEHAFDAMSDLVEAGYTPDIERAAIIRIRANGHLPRIYTHLRKGDEHVATWIAQELGIVAQGLEERDEVGLPKMLEFVAWRSARFLDTLTDWRSGQVATSWFTDATHLPLEKTEPYAAD